MENYKVTIEDLKLLGFRSGNTSEFLGIFSGPLNTSSEPTHDCYYLPIAYSSTDNLVAELDHEGNPRGKLYIATGNYEDSEYTLIIKSRMQLFRYVNAFTSTEHAELTPSYIFKLT